MASFSLSHCIIAPFVTEGSGALFHSGRCLFVIVFAGTFDKWIVIFILIEYSSVAVFHVSIF